MAEAQSSSQQVDYQVLAEQLSALAYPARLELLGLLRIPKLFSEIRLTPLRVAPGENKDRPSSRPTVQAHLEKLVDSNFVSIQDVGRGARKTYQYHANAQVIYALVEELRRINVMHAGRGPIGEATGTLAASAVVQPITGPRLILVHGVYEGKAFPLHENTAQDGRWVLGRRPGAAVGLDYDGFVSSEHAAITQMNGRFLLSDLSSKNGTAVNWRMLRRGEQHALKSAEVIGVGRSLFVFADD